MLPPDEPLDAPITLPHLRSPTPPLAAPYPTPNNQHLSYTSFVLDKSVTYTFRSQMLEELQQVTNNIIEGEATLRLALGRLWQALSEDPEKRSGSALVPKREDGEEEDSERDRRLARAPDLTPSTQKLFVTPYTMPPPPGYEHPSLDAQQETVEKSLHILRDFQDDGREYVERLEEIREVIGDVERQKLAVWDIVREKAVRELQDLAVSSGSAL